MSAVNPEASVRCRVNAVLPGCTGSPESVPDAEFRVIPAGSTPSLRVQVYGGVPPVPSTVAVYGEPALPSGSEGVVIASRALIVMLHGFVATPPATSFTCTENVDTPAVVGVPAKVPESAASVIPAGSAPEVMDQEYRGWPPVAVNVDV